MRSRIMYIEFRGTDDRLVSARLGRVSFSKRGKTLYYMGKAFLRVGRAEYMELESRGRYWITGARKDGNDRGGNRPGSFPIEIDEDVRQDYWKEIRGMPERAHERITYG